MSTPIDTSSLLRQLGTLAREAGVPPASRFGASDPVATEHATAGVAGMRPAAVTGGEGVDFAGLVADSLRTVEARGDSARALTEAYEQGRPDVELAEVMVAVQKARVSFEALTQVRNKMVSAYQDVMNTPL